MLYTLAKYQRAENEKIISQIVKFSWVYGVIKMVTGSLRKTKLPYLLYSGSHSFDNGLGDPSLNPGQTKLKPIVCLNTW